ncbi:MAG: NAD-dependent epimerase/dehydratase family protein [Candidatus Bipolaricaulota bacterium]|nr:NAD-dependent epimerase/dehydratase family protein [Candidatus Bipolaricaulota bacterium]
MKYLVTGANGFVGSNLVRDLLENDHEVRGLVRPSSNRVNLEGLDLELVEGDIRNPEDMIKSAEGVDGMFHTAALYSFWASSYDDFYRTNVEGTLNVLKGAKKADVDRVVVTSTASLLAHSNDKRSLPESTDQLPSDYKLSKYIAEKEALRFAEDTGLQVIIASPTVPIGPGDYGPTPTGRLILEFLNGKMKGYVDMQLNLVDVEDVARGHLLAMEKGESGERYVLGHKNWSLSDVIRLLAKLTGLPKPWFEIPYPIALTAAWIDEFVEGFLMNHKPTVPISAIHSTRVDERIDPSPWMEELGLPTTPTAKSLKKAVDWFLENGYVKNQEAVKS